MKNLFYKISNFGINSSTPTELAEETKLVNIISFLGIPICISFVFIFGLTGFYIHALTFLIGVGIFTLPTFLNKWFGLNVGRIFITIMAPLFFGIVSVMSGKDLGFYLGFLVVSVPPIIVFPTLKKAIIFVIISIILLVLSIVGNMFITPVAQIPFAMGIFILNLFTVLITIIALVYFFKSQLNESRAAVIEKNKEMTDSINYAKKIQTSLLAHTDFLNTNLPEHFVLFKPKDIVSGDFYWATKTKDFFYLAVCDSTGHGVPGAFMSLLNISFLNEAINEKNILEPNLILNHVRLRLIENMSGAQDGMDAILLKIPLNSTVSNIEYAAANNSPILIRNHEIIELAKNKMPVGKGENTSSFTSHTVELQKGDNLYLYTDGFADQFGGPKGKKFKYKALNNFLNEICNSSSNEQHLSLTHKFENWKGNLEQVDDVCLIGMKF
jgi:serine phosphatase RsbU (regulator of sigma subunit)